MSARFDVEKSTSKRAFFITRRAGQNAGDKMTVTESAPPSAPAPTTTAQTANGSEQKPERTFTQADVDAIVKARLDRERSASEKAQADAAKKAVDEAAAKNGEWQKLAETRAAEIEAANKRLTEYETAKAQLTEYETVIKAQAEAAKKDLPAYVLDLLNALSPAQQLAWLAKNADALGKRPAQTIPPTPAAANAAAVTEAELKRRQQIEAARVRSYT